MGINISDKEILENDIKKHKDEINFRSKEIQDERKKNNLNGHQSNENIRNCAKRIKELGDMIDDDNRIIQKIENDNILSNDDKNTIEKARISCSFNT